MPEGGLQPQVAVGGDGTVHLVYFKGDPASGDLFYVRRAPGQEDFSDPIRVNTQPGSAVAVGTIRGAQLALGKDERVHVVWNGSSKASDGAFPLLYTRLNDEGTGFEPERNVITWATGLDGGSSVAADQEGNVYVVWHAGSHGTSEAERGVYMAHSRDGGRTFERERKVNPDSTGVCGCCGLRAYADRHGAVYVLYRGARDTLHRDEHLLVSRDHGARFDYALVHPWEIEACPMSSAAFTEGASGVIAGWQTGDQVFMGRIELGAEQEIVPIPAAGTGEERKHPVMATAADGSTLLAWTEGAGWAKGGSLAWQVYDQDGVPTSEHGRVDGVPVWSMAAAYANSDGRFVLVY